MADSKIHRAAPQGLFARLMEPGQGTPGRGGAAGVGHGSVVSFKRPASPGHHVESADLADEVGEEGGAHGLFVARSSVIMPREPVAHPRLRPRLEGAAQTILQMCDEPMPLPTPIREAREPISKTEVDIAAFVEAVSAAYPQPRDPDVRPVLKARPKQAARPFVYLPGSAEEGAGDTGPEARQPVWNAAAIQQAHKEREMKAFHEFLDRMESAPLESLDRTLADLDEKADERRMFASPLALYDPILEADAVSYPGSVAREAAPVPEQDRPQIIEAVIEPLEPMAKPRLPQVPAGGVPPRLSPAQRAHLKRPTTLRDRHGRIAPVTYSLKPRTDA